MEECGMQEIEKQPELSVVMPCLNEVLTVGTCINKAHKCLTDLGVNYEIIIADNGSTDGSVELAEKLGARVVHQQRKGYGAALKAGIAAARGEYIIMGDCDDSYDFSGLAPFVEKLREGYFLVMGNRFSGGIKPGAMPPLHRYFGNPLLTFIGRMFFRASAFGDFYCGLRGFRTDRVRSLSLHSDGMEFALEMVIKFTMRGDWATEVPTTLSPDGRDRAPHLRSFRDGWRSLRFYMVMSPRWMYGLPGLILFIFGGAVAFRLFWGPWNLGDTRLDYFCLLYSGAVMLIGYQTIFMGIFAKLLAVDTGLHPPKTHLEPFRRRSTLIAFCLTGLLMLAVGSVLGCWGLLAHLGLGGDFFQGIDAVRTVIVSAIIMLAGAQTTMSGIYCGLINLVAEKQSEHSFEHASAESR